MRILITGINGFVGTLISHELAIKGHDVYGIDINGNDAHIFSIDIRNIKSVIDVIKKIKPEFIVHLAGIARVDFENPQDIYDINVNGTLNVLTASAKLSKLPRFLHISSSLVYGKGHNGDKPTDETFPVTPVNHYGASKAASENIAKAFYHEYNIPVVIARPYNHTGRGQTEFFVIPKMVSAFKKGLKEITLGNVNTVRDISDVRDIVNAYIKLIENFKAGQVFNIASGTGYKIIEIFELLKDITGNSMKIISDNELMRKSEIAYLVGDASRIKSIIGWEPQYSLRETLSWMLND